jgi:FMN phosphatase YigB (HAD superfamily)
MKKKKLISFDLDNTLIDPTYTTFVWEIGIPQLYAKKHNISISEATPIVIAEYEKIGDVSLEWYDITYWFKFFELPGRWENLLEAHRDKIRPFPEVKEVLKDLAQYYDLIVTSNAAREFVEVEIKEAEIEDCFIRIFSATSNAIHTGDHYEFDYIIPKSVGIKAYYLDRDGKKSKDSFTVKNLKEFAALIKNLSGLCNSHSSFL